MSSEALTPHPLVWFLLYSYNILHLSREGSGSVSSWSGAQSGGVRLYICTSWRSKAQIKISSVLRVIYYIMYSEDMTA